ncbi:hypothetical protein GPJ56_002372 [Histomonas meleagridis]|uniref:uncharacterized protein n=1 Tax=Histomonas meleagridis TaxID=135588 RepID=UPI00355A8AC4|nr:hypothetical protein GPJ56_002372 [Histomonas meleagridis]KAH0801896.1 hypothetical protein GO595_005314 [Histomonas meleagridis]
MKSFSSSSSDDDDFQATESDEYSDDLIPEDEIVKEEISYAKDLLENKENFSDSSDSDSDFNPDAVEKNEKAYSDEYSGDDNIKSEKNIKKESSSDDSSFKEESDDMQYSEDDSEFLHEDQKLLQKEEQTKELQIKQREEIVSLLRELISIIQPINSVNEALCNTPLDEETAKSITHISTKLLFYGKYDIYSCGIAELQSELENLENSP